MNSPTKIYKNRGANLLGLQVARIVIARVLLVTRRVLYRHRKQDSEVEALIRNGFVVIPHFLSETDFQQVRWEFQLGTTRDELVTKRVVDTAGLLRISCTVSSANRRVFERTVKCFLGSDRLQQILAAYDGRRSLRSVGSTFQLSFWRTQRNDSVVEDHEMADHTNTELHSDSFQSVIKFFFYLDDVAEENGPHAYVPGSHRLTFWRILFEYVNSVTSMRESPRVQGLTAWAARQPPQQQCYPANTLIVADTFGFHKALLPLPGKSRSIVYLQYRSPPFR